MIDASGHDPTVPQFFGSLNSELWRSQRLAKARLSARPRLPNIPKGDKHMAKQSAQHKLDRVRPPRVQITYDVEVGGAIEIKELPFVVGVLGDFTGNPEQPLPKLKERKFVEVNPDNFDTVLEGMKPHLSFAVENKLSDEPDAPNLKIDLKFRKFDDFEPANVAKQVKPLKELLDLRTRLSDLRGSLQGNDKLEELLLEAVGNTEKLDQLKKEIAPGGENA
jgi:type VI secretion system protein ImpB